MPSFTHALVQDLLELLQKLDGKTYTHYKSLRGSWSCPDWTFTVDRVPKSPEDHPALCRLRLPQAKAGFPADWMIQPLIALPLSDLILRRFQDLLKKISRPSGPGKGGRFYGVAPGPQVLPRSAVILDASFVELSFQYGLPAAGNRIDGDHFAAMVTHALPRIVEKVLKASAYGDVTTQTHLHCYEDQETLRRKLQENNLAAFIPDGALLPRMAPGDDRPLADALVFKSPESCAMTFKTPHRGSVRGLGIPRGVTVITGPGFHGKTTLLDAIGAGIYNHIPGDGREYLVTDPTAFKINIENGRPALGVDISPYVRNLPFGRDARDFHTDWCSGSTSQACTVIESLRMGCRCLLFDEDTSAVNFMTGDPLLEDLLPPGTDTLQPFVQTVRDLTRQTGTACIIAAGNSGPYLAAADLVLLMLRYQVEDITGPCRDRLQGLSPRLPDAPFPVKVLDGLRRLRPDALKLSRSVKPVPIQVAAQGKLKVGSHILDFHHNEHLVEFGQTAFIARILPFFEDIARHGVRNFETAIQEVFRQLTLPPGKPRETRPLPGLTVARPLDVAYALNRFRFLKSMTALPGETLEGNNHASNSDRR